MTNPTGSKLTIFVLAGALFVMLFLMFMMSERLPEKFFLQAVRSSEQKLDPRHAEEMRQREISKRFEQGVAMLTMREFDHAVTAFHRVLTLAPRMPEAHLNMGFALFELKDYQGAQRFFEGVKVIAPSFPNADYGLALSLFAQNKNVEAIHFMANYLRQVSESDPFRRKAEEKMAEMISAAKSRSGG